MRLTPIQRQILQNYVELQSREPSYRRAFLKSLPVWMLLAAVAFAAWYVMRTWLNGGGLEHLLLGIAIGAIAVQVGAIRHFVGNWPVLNQTLDLEAVKRLLADDDAGKAAGEPVRLRPLPFGWRTALAIALWIVALPLALDFGMTAYFDPTRDTAGKQVKLYTAVWCGPCRVVRAHLRGRGVDFEEFDVEKSIPAHYAWSATKARGIPVTVIDNKIVSGARLEKIDGLLREAGFELAEIAGPLPAGQPLLSPLKR